eukprot:1317317-Pyramimonas_sp.AAC.1
MAVLGGGGRMRAVPLGPSVKLLIRPRSAVLGGWNAGSKGCAGWWQAHAGGATETLGGAPYGATERCTGCVKRRGQWLHWVVADARGRCKWEFRWNSLWGHEA